MVLVLISLLFSPESKPLLVCMTCGRPVYLLFELLGGNLLFGKEKRSRAIYYLLQARRKTFFVCCMTALRYNHPHSSAAFT